MSVVSESEFGAQRVGDTLKGRYRIERVLQFRADTTIYAGTDQKAGRVAIKVLARADTSALRRSYLANAVGHPAAVNVLDTGTTDDGAAFLVMELLEGRSLRALLAEHGGRLPVRLACAIGDQCLDLLACAHAQGIAHGELSLDVLFWTRSEQLKVLGFGKQPPDPDDAELARAARATAIEADVLALTNLLACLLLGEGHPARPTEGLATTAWNRLPAGIRAVIERGQASEAAERWPSARAMRTALQLAWQKDLGRPVDAGLLPAPVSPAPRRTRAVWAAALSALLGVLLLWLKPAPPPPAASGPSQERTTSIMAAENPPLAADTAPTRMPPSADAPPPSTNTADTPVQPSTATPVMGAQSEGPRTVRRRGIELPPMRRRAGMPSNIEPASALCAQLSSTRRTRSLSEDEQQLWNRRCSAP